MPLKPKLTEAPGATEPFQPRFLAVQWVPELVTVASQAEPTAVPEGKSHSMVQEDRAVVPVFLTVHWPSKPLPQSDFLTKEAVAEVAASAGEARPTIAASGSSSAVVATALDLVALPDPSLNRVRRRGVSVLNGAPRVRSGQTGVVRGLQTLRRPEHPLSWRAHRSVLGEIRKVWTNRQEVWTKVRG